MCDSDHFVDRKLQLTHYRDLVQNMGFLGGDIFKNNEKTTKNNIYIVAPPGECELGIGDFKEKEKSAADSSRFICDNDVRFDLCGDHKVSFLRRIILSSLYFHLAVHLVQNI